MNESQGEIFEEIKEKVTDVINHHDIKTANDLVKEVKFQLEKFKELYGDEEVTVEYSKMLVRLQMLRLALLKDEEVLSLIRENVIEMINDSDLVLEERIECRQLILPDSLRFEDVNQPIMEALHENIEWIGERKIFVAGVKSLEFPIVKNWLLDYDRTYGTEPQKDLIWLDYVRKNIISANLNAEQVNTLRKLLKLYEWLKIEHEIE